jgi:branched-chain amino acid transport system ATP-binding protein
MGPLLEVEGLTKFFGAVRAADRLDLRVEEGEVVGIVGSNGSGKTTFLNLVTGYIKPDAGRILLAGRATSGLSPRLITRLGVARSFQIPQLYPALTVLENVLLSLTARSDGGTGVWRPLYRAPWIGEGEEVLRRLGLEAYTNRSVGELPEGGRKLLDIALALVLRPRLLLMDEPTSGVSSQDKFRVMDTLLGALQQAKITSVFVEHDMDVVLRYSRRVLVFDQGLVIADGEPSAVLANPDVRRAVLGRA